MNEPKEKTLEEHQLIDFLKRNPGRFKDYPNGYQPSLEHIKERAQQEKSLIRLTARKDFQRYGRETAGSSVGKRDHIGVLTDGRTKKGTNPLRSFQGPAIVQIPDEDDQI